MTEDYGFWSLLPPLIAIVLAIRTRQVLISLLAGIWVGWMIINRGNPLAGTVDTMRSLVSVFSNPSSTQTVIFTLLTGSLIIFIQRSGGVEGFINSVENRFSRGLDPSDRKIRVRIQLLAAFTGLLIFVESNISALTVGTLFRPLTDRLKISREKLAYLADSTSAPSSILIPINAWGGFVMGLLVLQGYSSPFPILLKSIPFNFYPLVTIILLALITITGRDFGPMKRAEARSMNEGKLTDDNSSPSISSDITFLEKKEGITARPMNMAIPIATMVIAMPFMLIFTGWQSVTPGSNGGFLSDVVTAISNSSGSEAVLFSVASALAVSIILYSFQRILTIMEQVELMLKGMSGMVPLALLMVLAFATGNLCNELHTGSYIAEASSRWLSPHLVPFIIFIISCIIAFSTGTSWGTFAIMISIAIPVAQTLDINIYLVVAAVLGGGVFGDHCSPISDTTIISSMASASDHIDHVRTQLPYALAAGLLSSLLYILAGFLL